MDSIAGDVQLAFTVGCSSSSIESVEIRWPLEKIEQLKDLGIDKFYSILEGRGVLPAEKFVPLFQ